MRKTISVAALLLALTCPVYAGDIQNDAPKPPTNAVQEPTDGETLNGEIATPRVSDSLTQIALDMLAALPSLL